MRLPGVLRILVVTIVAAPLAAQPPPPAAPIMDNSFLIEEAYNQESGVVQHISFFQRARGGSWAYAFTQEWPFRGQKHQLSYTIPVLHSSATGGGSTGPGDLALNYRLQLLGGDSRVWVAPRVSLTVPTGRWQAGRGDGVVGAQVALPVSLQMTPRLVGHLNAGLSVLPSARGASGHRATRTGYAAGASVIFLMRSAVNLMVESVAERVPEITGPGRTESVTSVFISPGIRWAHNFKNGLQIVPGLAYARGIGDASDDSRLLVYISFEHPFKRRAE